MDALLKSIIVFAFLNLIDVHFSQIEHGALWPQLKGGYLNFHIHLTFPLNLHPHIQDSKIISLVFLPQVGGK